MAGYVVRRLFQLAGVLALTSGLLFVALFVLPGDPVASLAGSDRARDPAVVAELRRRYGLDRPLPTQYLRYVGRLARGDLGVSYRLGRPVNDVLGARLGNTAELALAAVVVETVLGVGAGAVAALARRSFWDVLAVSATAVLVGVPTLVVGLAVQRLFGVQLGWLPSTGHHGAASIVLPAVTAGAADAAVVARLTRASLLGALGYDHFLTALAKGLSRRRALLRHALPASVVPALTYLGIAFGTLLGGALVTEVVFGWNGVGQALVTATAAHDTPVVVGIALYATAAFVAVNLVVDVASAWLDPRVRAA